MEEALKEIFNVTGGSKWTDKTGWMSRVSLRDWTGVKIDESGQVNELDLEDNNLQSKLS